MDEMLIIKVGSTLSSLIPHKGDFEHWILTGMGVSGQRVRVIDVRDGASLPPHEGLSGVVVTGSHAAVTAHAAWSERVAAWLPEAVARGIPTLGICYGHQLLAYALGGEVGDNPRGHEFGTLAVALEDSARGDPLLGGFSSPIRVHLSHRQSVLRLPEQAIHLASSQRDTNQAFRVGDCAWGVQFHPEFDAGVVRAYVRHFRGALLAEGQDPERLAEGCVDTPYGAEILRRFGEIASETGPVLIN